MLHESQEEVKELRSKTTPSAGLRRHISHSLYPMVSYTPLSLSLSRSTTHQTLPFTTGGRRKCFSHTLSSFYLSPSLTPPFSITPHSKSIEV